MIDEECLTYSFYEYLKYCENVARIRGVGLITDKQSLFYSQIDPHDNSTHEWIAMDLEHEIHPKLKVKGALLVRPENIHYFSMGKELIIDLPEDLKFTMSQYLFLEELLDQIEEYNKENPKEKKVWILINCSGNHFRNYDTYNVLEIKKELQTMVTKDFIIEEEKIIGNTHSKEQIIKNMLYQIDLDDLENSSDRIKQYYKDTYYKKYLLEIIDKYNITNVNIKKNKSR